METEVDPQSFNPHKVAAKNHVSNARFYYAVQCGYFKKVTTPNGWFYECNVETFESRHARKVVEKERSRRKKDNLLFNQSEIASNSINKNIDLEIKTFSPPSIEEVRQYCAQRRNDVNPEKWFAHYEAVGWKVGNKTMRDWKAAIHTWEHNNYNCIPRKIETFSDQELHENHKKRGLIQLYTVQELADEIKRKGGSGIIEMKTTYEF